ncbi:hypothetical protein CARUB_v10003463mg [Capsella rubella]|uniref:WPP domain-containing protein n=1 Tax=Capsella rubella TaxID=81985 RepID=R0FL96_9BRAS|nr:WPP domain-containing protein 3 [Capsella rubella]EOA22751.1 hypothetical protein CARUB_v10003463mg [Capsella rubella]
MADTIKTTVTSPQPESERSCVKRSRSEELVAAINEERKKNGETLISLKKMADTAEELVAAINEERKKHGETLLSVWPPSQQSREYGVNWMIDTLSKDSFLTKRYGKFKPEEASAVAKSIEEESYVVASKVVSAYGIKNLDVYGTEIGDRINQCAKDRCKTNGTIKSTS